MTNTQPESVMESWVYVGRVPTVSGKVYHKWLRPDGEHSLFAKITGSIGGVYEVDITRQPDGAITLHGNPKYIRPSSSITAEDLAQWRADDRAAAAHKDRESAEAKLRKESGDIGAMTLADAKRWVNGATFGRRASRMAVILNYLGD